MMLSIVKLVRMELSFRIADLRTLMPTLKNAFTTSKTYRSRHQTCQTDEVQSEMNRIPEHRAMARTLEFQLRVRGGDSAEFRSGSTSIDEIWQQRFVFFGGGWSR